MVEINLLEKHHIYAIDNIVNIKLNGLIMSHKVRQKLSDNVHGFARCGLFKTNLQNTNKMTTKNKFSENDFKPASCETGVSGSLSKREKLSLLSADIFARRNDYNFHLTSELCAVIWHLSKGTKSEYDCKEIIKSVYPEFFQDCH